jgi:hypothetical protein
MAGAYLKMADRARPGTTTDFVDRMNAVPKFVASGTKPRRQTGTRPGSTGMSPPPSQG